jgi:hypothetical protein
VSVVLRRCPSRIVELRGCQAGCGRKSLSGIGCHGRLVRPCNVFTGGLAARGTHKHGWSVPALSLIDQNPPGTVSLLNAITINLEEFVNGIARRDWDNVETAMGVSPESRLGSSRGARQGGSGARLLAPSVAGPGPFRGSQASLPGELAGCPIARLR